MAFEFNHGWTMGLAPHPPACIVLYNFNVGRFPFPFPTVIYRYCAGDTTLIYEIAEFEL